MGVKVGPRVTDFTGAFFAHWFPSMNAGSEYVLNAFPFIYRHTITDLKGRFSRQELLLMLDACRDLTLTPHLAGQHLPPAIRNAITLESADHKWGVDLGGAKLFEKINTLAVFAVSCLEIWCRAFWESGEFEGECAASEYVEAIESREDDLFVFQEAEGE